MSTARQGFLSPWHSLSRVSPRAPQFHPNYRPGGSEAVPSPKVWPLLHPSETHRAESMTAVLDRDFSEILALDSPLSGSNPKASWRGTSVRVDCSNPYRAVKDPRRRKLAMSTDGACTCESLNPCLPDQSLTCREKMPPERIGTVRRRDMSKR